jgi:hypothetical protein
MHHTPSALHIFTCAYSKICYKWGGCARAGHLTYGRHWNRLPLVGFRVHASRWFRRQFGTQFRGEILVEVNWGKLNRYWIVEATPESLHFFESCFKSFSCWSLIFLFLLSTQLYIYRYCEFKFCSTSILTVRTGEDVQGTWGVTHSTWCPKLCMTCDRDVEVRNSGAKCWQITKYGFFLPT